MKKSWKQITLGMIMGGFIGTAFGWWSWVHVHSMRHPPEKKWERKMERFSKKLDLSSQQRVQVRAIFQNKHKVIVALHAEMAPRFQKVHQTAIFEIREILQDDQREKFDAYEKKRAKWHKRYASLHGNPHFGFPAAHFAKLSNENPDY